MEKSTSQPLKGKKKEKEVVVSKIIIIKINDRTHVKVLQKGDKAVVRQGAEIIFNNLKNKSNFDKWWEESIEGLSKSTKLDVVKSEIVDNDAMDKIHTNYK